MDNEDSNILPINGLAALVSDSVSGPENTVSASESFSPTSAVKKKNSARFHGAIIIHVYRLSLPTYFDMVYQDSVLWVHPYILQQTSSNQPV